MTPEQRQWCQDFRDLPFPEQRAQWRLLDMAERTLLEAHHNEELLQSQPNASAALSTASAGLATSSSAITDFSKQSSLPSHSSLLPPEYVAARWEETRQAYENDRGPLGWRHGAAAQGQYQESPQQQRHEPSSGLSPPLRQDTTQFTIRQPATPPPAAGAPLVNQRIRDWNVARSPQQHPLPGDFVDSQPATRNADAAGASTRGNAIGWSGRSPPSISSPPQRQEGKQTAQQQQEQRIVPPAPGAVNAAALPPPRTPSRGRADLHLPVEEGLQQQQHRPLRQRPAPLDLGSRSVIPGLSAEGATAMTSHADAQGGMHAPEVRMAGGGGMRGRHPTVQEYDHSEEDVSHHRQTRDGAVHGDLANDDEFYPRVARRAPAASLPTWRTGTQTQTQTQVLPPPPPAHLSASELARWHRLCAELESMYADEEQLAARRLAVLAEIRAHSLQLSLIAGPAAPTGAGDGGSGSLGQGTGIKAHPGGVVSADLMEALRILGIKSHGDNARRGRAAEGDSDSGESTQTVRRVGAKEKHQSRRGKGGGKARTGEQEDEDLATEESDQEPHAASCRGKSGAQKRKERKARQAGETSGTRKSD